jgi:hypothetical protein
MVLSQRLVVNNAFPPTAGVGAVITVTPLAAPGATRRYRLFAFHGSHWAQFHAAQCRMWVQFTQGATVRYFIVVCTNYTGAFPLVGGMPGESSSSEWLWFGDVGIICDPNTAVQVSIQDNGFVCTGNYEVMYTVESFA